MGLPVTTVVANVNGGDETDDRKSNMSVCVCVCVRWVVNLATHECHSLQCTVKWQWLE